METPNDKAAMWNELREWVKESIADYRSGFMMSMRESAYGESIMGRVKEVMEKLEKGETE